MTTNESLSLFSSFMVAKNFSESTQKTYENIVIRFMNQSKVNPQNVKRGMVWTYTNAIKSARTRNQTIGCLKTFFKHICGMPHIVNVPYAKADKVLPKIISRVGFDNGVSRCSNPKHRLIFKLMFCHGLRVGEVLDCRISWFASQVIDGQKQYTLNVTGKGSKDRRVWLSPDTMNELVFYTKKYDIDLHNRDQYLFQSPSGGKYSSGSVRALTHRFFGLNPHALRHSFATELVNRDVNQKKIQSALGHSSSRTTEIYTHTSIKSMIGISA